jgi:hypothetical protein
LSKKNLFWGLSEGYLSCELLADNVGVGLTSSVGVHFVKAQFSNRHCSLQRNDQVNFTKLQPLIIFVMVCTKIRLIIAFKLGLFFGAIQNF